MIINEKVLLCCLLFFIETKCFHSPQFYSQYYQSFNPQFPYKRGIAQYQFPRNTNVQNLIQNRLPLQDFTQNRPPSQDFTQNRPPSQDFTQNRPPSQDFTQNRPPSQDFSQNRPPLQDFTQNRPPSQDFSQNRPPSQDFTQNRPPSQDFTQNRPPSQDFTQNRPPSQDFSQNIPQLQDFAQNIPPPQDFTQNRPPLQDLTEDRQPSQDLNQNGPLPPSPNSPYPNYWTYQEDPGVPPPTFPVPETTEVVGLKIILEREKTLEHMSNKLLFYFMQIAVTDFRTKLTAAFNMSHLYMDSYEEYIIAKQCSQCSFEELKNYLDSLLIILEKYPPLAKNVTLSGHVATEYERACDFLNKKFTQFKSDLEDVNTAEDFNDLRNTYVRKEINGGIMTLFLNWYDSYSTNGIEDVEDIQKNLIKHLTALKRYWLIKIKGSFFRS